MASCNTKTVDTVTEDDNMMEDDNMWVNNTVKLTKEIAVIQSSTIDHSLVVLLCTGETESIVMKALS